MKKRIVMRHDARNIETGNPAGSEQKLVRALQMLFDLLEDYAPRWYTEEHHHYAYAALASAKRSRSRLSLRHPPNKQQAA
jgi:hypothetical protein